MDVERTWGNLASFVKGHIVLIKKNCDFKIQSSLYLILVFQVLQSLVNLKTVCRVVTGV
jgi:hypothetical protein